MANFNIPQPLNLHEILNTNSAVILSNDTPSAPEGNQNVAWQVDEFGNLSANVAAGGGGGGNVATIGVTMANGVSGVSSGGDNPLLTISLGDIVPSSVNGLDLTGNGSNGNIAIGVGTAPSTAGTNNVSVGKLALHSATTGQGNVAVGFGASYKNTSNNFNTAVGYTALEFNTADSNTAVGSSALTANTGGQNGVAIGAQALVANTTGNNNTAVGSGALLNNTTALQNTAVGWAALTGSVGMTGSDNTAIGVQALNDTTSGSFNVGVGQDALFSIQTGSYNTAIGTSAADNISDGSTSVLAVNHGVFIGYNVEPLADGSTNEVIIGDSAVGHGSNTVTLGNSSTAALYLGSTRITVSAPLAYWATSGYTSGSTAAVGIANHTICAGIIIPYGGVSAGHISFESAAGDGGGVLSDVGIFNAAGTLIANVGAQSLSSGASVYTLPFVQGTVFIPEGKAYIGYTSTGTTFALQAKFSVTTFLSAVDASQTTTGGELTNITPPADSPILNGLYPAILLTP